MNEADQAVKERHVSANRAFGFQFWRSIVRFSCSDLSGFLSSLLATGTATIAEKAFDALHVDFILQAA